MDKIVISHVVTKFGNVRTASFRMKWRIFLDVNFPYFAVIIAKAPPQKIIKMQFIKQTM